MTDGSRKRSHWKLEVVSWTTSGSRQHGPLGEGSHPEQSVQFPSSTPSSFTGQKFFFCFVFLSLSLLGLHLWHMEVPKLGVEMELWPLAYTTATAARDPSRICNLHTTGVPVVAQQK